VTEVNRLPEGWDVSNLAEISTSVGGGTPSKSDPSYWVEGTIPWVSPKDMKVFDLRTTEDLLNPKALEKLSLVPENSVLVVVRSGILSRTLPVALNAVPVTINQDMRAFAPEIGVNARFIAWQLVLKERSILDRCAKDGTTVASIEGPALASFSLAIAPSNEQSRIVTKLEELLSDLKAGEAELKAANQKLTQYRQSLLKTAMEGALTAKWRTNCSVTETGVQLLERVLIERRNHWESKQLAKFKEQGKTPPKDWQKKYPEPVQLDTAGLHQLPEGWAWASLDMLGEIASGVAKGSKRDSDVVVREVPYLRVANVQRGYLDLSEVKTIYATERDITSLTLMSGDVLFNEGGDRDKLGRGWVWRDEVKECIHQNHVFRMRPYLPELQPELISHHGNTFGKLWFQNAGKQTTNLASINLTMLRSFPVPVPPAIEQLEILEQIQLQLDSLNRQAQVTEQAIQQCVAQRHNILRAAFSGKLVLQAPDDEPATVLLERIRAERAERAKQPKIRKTKKQKGIAAMVSKLIDVLAEAGDWISAQEAFRRCGVTDGAQTDRVEELYAELRKLDVDKRLQVKPIMDEQGRKQSDLLKLVAN